MTTRLLALLVMGLLGTTLLVGCSRHSRHERGGDDDDDAAADGDADSDSDGDVDADGDSDGDVDADADGDGDVEGRGEYPRGPYGTQNGDTIANYAFETSDGTLTLNDLRQDRAYTMMMIYGGSESCGWCVTESPEVDVAFAEHEADGFLPFGVLMDNGFGGSPTGPDAERFFGHHAEYPFAASPWVFGALSIEWADATGVIGLPANVFIDLETMEILERIDGYPQPGGVAPIIESYLSSF